MGFSSEVCDWRNPTQPSRHIVCVYISFRPEIAEPTPETGVLAGMWKLLRQMRMSSSAAAFGKFLEEQV